MIIKDSDMTEDKSSKINIPIQWLKDILGRNKEFKIDIAELHSYFGGDFFGKDPEAICQDFKDILLKEGIDVRLDKYDNRIDRLIFTKFFKPYAPPQNIQDKISKYQKEIDENISWLRYMIRINKGFTIDVTDLRSHFGGNLYEENHEELHLIFKYILSKEGIDVTLLKFAGKNDLTFKKFSDSEDIRPQDANVKKLKFINRVPLKPWKDPESLFCDTKFLKEFLGKEPRKGKECKDK